MRSRPQTDGTMEGGSHSLFDLGSNYFDNYLYGEEFECDYEGRKIFVFNCILTIFGILSAVVLVSVLLSKRHLRSASYWFLNMLIISFLLQLVLCGFVYTEEAFDPCWRIGQAFCTAIKIMEPILMNSVAVFLSAVAVQQYFRYQSVIRVQANCTLVVLILCFTVFLLCVPEMVIALSETTPPKSEPHSCHVKRFPSRGVYFVMTFKQLLLEYFCPLSAVYILIVAIVCTRVGSNPPPSTYTPTGPVLPQVGPKYLVLLVALTVTFTIGYLPRYVFMLATVIMQINPQGGRGSDIWGHLITVDTVFALIPPAFVPLFVLLLSRPHLKAAMELAHHVMMKIRGNGRRSGYVEENNQEEEIIAINMEPVIGFDTEIRNRERTINL